jgi:hypothetical protein
MRRLDLEAGTNSDGKVKFAGLPARVQRPPLEFHASRMSSSVSRVSIGQANAPRHDITLENPKAPDGH